MKKHEICFVSHNMEDVKSLCDRVLWLDHGTMKMLGGRKKLSMNMNHNITGMPDNSSV